MGLYRKLTTVLLSVVAAGALSPLANGQTASPDSSATPMADVRDRGVRIIRAEPAPAPSPAVATPPVAPSTNKAVAPVRATAPVLAPVIKTCPRPFPADLTLRQDMNSRRFDRALRPLLAKRPPQLVVDLAKPYGSDAEPPAALVPWLDEIRKFGGAVSVARYCYGSRGFLGNFLNKLFGGGKGDAYAAIRGYDAVLQVDALDNRVTQVRFVPRAVAAQ